MRMKITSAANPRVKLAAKLRGSRDRAAQGRIIVDGLREIARAVDAGVRVVEVFVCEELIADNDAANTLLARLARADLAQYDLPLQLLEKLSFGERTEGIVAVAETPRRTLADLRPPESPLVA